jgi:hypothetical protein
MDDKQHYHRKAALEATAHEEKKADFGMRKQT